jgi:hypothetical protein
MFEIDVLDPQPAAFEHSEPAAIEQLSHQPGLSGRNGYENPLRLVAREDDRQPLWFFRAFDAADPGQRLLENLPVKEQQGRKRLILRAGRDLPLQRQVSQSRAPRAARDRLIRKAN